MNIKNTLFVEKYRPQKIQDCILPKATKDIFEGIVKSGDIPNLLLAGSPGTGKTTVAMALCNEMNLDVLKINASDENGIDTLRTKLKNFAGTVSLNGGKKVVILDEADYLTNAAQPALRGIIEEFSHNCRFILTCNFKNKIIAPLHSRCKVIDFTIKKDDKLTLMSQLMKRVIEILDTEGITYDQKVVAEFIKKHFPDNRRILNELQSYAKSGSIDTGILSSFKNEEISKLMEILKKKEFKNMREWVAENSDSDIDALYTAIYENMYEHVSPDSIPEFVVLVHEYMYKSAFVMNKEINLVAFLTMVMAQIGLK